ncbi:MAG: hypothetical protein UU54_C0004G0015 [Candidatus Yanofskybacteria bacterium GW2011_GWA2_41_22]|uniref:Uncharacterized protein n=1 Tax=Candidatus Yanofskybacteria bacterium GW2011_GWA2_41_22 TaxID=1619023 RepID=A0A0G0VP68_9BACT|nr:MAG: hypothetical protein UU54_C0004G0015 [Candidatus Yanofskybacteria bacterium GW2011_GWA2_41_22]
MSGHDPRVPGPDDLLAKTNGFIKSGSDENLTEKLSSLITAGLYAGDLQKTAPTQTYESAINNLGLSVIDNGYAALNPSLENTATVSDSRENQEKYLSEVIDILENKLMNGFLFTPYKLSVFSQKLISSDPQKVKTISVELLSEAMNFQNNAEIMKKISVPASWKEIHLELLGSIRSLALSFQAMSYFDQDPMKAIVAIRNIEDIYSNAPKLLAKIAQKAKTNNLQIPNSKFLNLIGSIANELVSVDIPRTIAWIKTVIVRTLARKMLTMFSNKLISKIRGSGRDGGPAFVRNWRNFITEGQYRGEDIFKTVLASTPVCNYLDKSIKDAFRIDGSQKIPFRGNNVRVSDLDPFDLREACTLPSGFDMAAYRRDFAGNGGWDAWSRLMEPQNNYYGLLFEALDELKKQRDLSQSADLAEATSGSGYTSIRDGCEDLPPIDTTLYTCGGESSGTCPAGQQCQTTDGQHYKCEGTPVATPPPSNARCTFMGKVFTPADLLGKSAAATIDAEMGWLISSQQIADIAVGILNAVIDRLGNLAESAGSVNRSF